MPVPQTITRLSEFKKKLAAHRAQKVNVLVQKSFCWWCGDHSSTLIWKYWHGFCEEKCWKEYRDSRLGRTYVSRPSTKEEEIIEVAVIL